MVCDFGELGWGEEVCGAIVGASGLGSHKDQCLHGFGF